MTAPAQGGPGIPQLADPGQIGGTRPRIADLRNRCVIVQPLSIARGVPGVQAGTVQDRITANVFVIDGGPLEFGGKPEKYVPHTLVVPTPYLAEGLYISQTNMVSQLSPSLPSPQNPQGGLVVGVIMQGKASKAEHNPPWNLVTLEESDPRRGYAAQLLQAFFTGQFRNPEPQQTGAPTPPGGPLAYTHAATMPHDPATGQPIPNLAEFSAPVGQLQDSVQQDYNRMIAAQQYAAMQAQYTATAPTQPQYTQYVPQGAMQQYPAVHTAPTPAAPAAAPGQDPRYLEWLAQQQAPASAAPNVGPAPAAAGPLPGGFYGATSAPAAPTPSQQAAADPAPPGWSQDMWANMSPEQKASIRASSAPVSSAPAAAGNGMPPF